MTSRSAVSTPTPRARNEANHRVWTFISSRGRRELAQAFVLDRADMLAGGRMLAVGRGAHTRGDALAAMETSIVRAVMPSEKKRNAIAFLIEAIGHYNRQKNLLI